MLNKNVITFSSRMHGLAGPPHLRLTLYRPQRAKDIKTGMSVIEVVIAAVILALASLTSISLFNTYVLGTADARQRDGIMTLILRDLEGIKSQAGDLWKDSTASTSSMTVFNPPSANCTDRTLASAAPSSNTVFTTGSTNLTIPPVATRSLGNPVISRRISHSGNLIQVTYSSSAPVRISLTTKIMPPAVGWCP